MPERGGDRLIEYIKSDEVEALAVELADRIWQDRGEKIMEPILADKSSDVRRVRPKLRAELVYYGLVLGLIQVLSGVKGGMINFASLKP